MSAADPNKCCRVLVTWFHTYTKYERWSESTAATVPPNKLAVPNATKSSFEKDGQALVSQEVKDRIPASQTRGGGDSPRNIVVTVDPEGSIRNAAYFDPKRRGEGTGRTEAFLDKKKTNLEGGCKRLTKNPKAPKTCNCYDFTGGKLVSEKFTLPEIGAELGPESAELNNPALGDSSLPIVTGPTTTASISPEYICYATVTWEEYIPFVGWTRIIRELPYKTFKGSRIPVITTTGRKPTAIGVLKYEKEMDCCL